MMLHICQAGYETFAAKELGTKPQRSGPGWVAGPEAAGEQCFTHLCLREPAAAGGASLNALAGGIADFFLASVRRERFETPWPFVAESAGLPGLGRRTKGVAEEALARIRARMSRVAKLAVPGRPRIGPARGLFIYLTAFDAAFIAREAVCGGQRRMADDPRAPSRSYLKIEEAYGLLAQEPAPGETVVDLGAAPGGWSYSAAKRGARVCAVDNGPLKGGALHPEIRHLESDAFSFEPECSVDWLFCDMVEDPDRVLGLVGRWLKHRWCRRLVVNLKFGRLDPLTLARRCGEVRARCRLSRLRHLYHDREELTLAAEAA
ncbi:MAG: rRNA methyltransferase [Elusimicrobia bacterium]|nr:rRNA methyltransferase [Elusimicrobiota bacterium]